MHPVILALCCAISVHVHTPNGAPVGGARVTIGARAGTAVTDANGNALVEAAPGHYQLRASARGYDGVSADLEVRDATAIDIALSPLDAPTMRTIATVTVDGRLAPVHGEVPSVVVTRASMDALGENRAVDALMALPSATFTRPDGGGAAGISVVSLRGPDPSESLIALDGQTLNDGNTGDVDLSRFPAAAFSAIDVSEGLGPEDTNGSNTFGGAINFVSLQPTRAHHVSFSTSAGSWGQSEASLNATGSQKRLGYAIALDDQHEAGYVNQLLNLHSTIDPACNPCQTPVGSSVASRLGLANLSYTFSPNADVAFRLFTLGDDRDMSASTTGVQNGAFFGPGAESLLQNIRAYQLRGRAPLGAGELIADLSDSDNGVTIDGNANNPAYDVTHADHRYNAGLTWQRSFATSEFAVGGYTRYESLQFLDPAGNSPLLGQSINAAFVRGGFEPIEQLRIDAGLFESHYTSFGSNLDGRIGATYEFEHGTSLRLSAGTGFRAPLLIERYQFPLAELTQDANGVFVGQGSPDEHPEHATEYELGVSQRFPSATLDLSLYQTNLRDPIEIYYPLALAQSGACLAQSAGNPVPGCLSYNSNVGNAVYQGAELRFVQNFAPHHLFVTARYGLNVAYPRDLTADFSNPTSSGDLVDNQQFLGIPQQQGSLELQYARKTWSAAAQAIFRGNNNELNQGPVTFIDAAVKFNVNDASDITLAGTNLFNAAAGRFTQLGAGVPYLGVGGTPIPTDKLVVEPASVRFIFTIHE
jgi:outer membrane cobalamin receptor